MAYTLDALRKQIESSDTSVKINECTEHLLSFGTADCLCVVRMHHGTLTCDVSKPIKKSEPGLDDYRKINDLINETRFGKHSLKYDPEKRNFNYIFALEFDAEHFDVLDTVQYAMKAFAIAYDIINLPDTKTAYRRIETYSAALSMSK